MNEVNVDKLTLYGRFSCGKNVFLGCRNDVIVKLLCIILTKMNGYSKQIDKVKCMSFLIENKQLLKTQQNLGQR